MEFGCICRSDLYRMIQDERSLFLEVAVSVIVRKELIRTRDYSESLPKYSCSNLQTQKHCEW